MNDNEIQFSDVPNEQYRKFFAKFNEINNLPITSWTAIHLLGYFCKKYKECYGKEYKFKFNTTAPSKCFEVFQIKRLALNLSSDVQLLKDYVDWVFDLVFNKKKKFFSISYLNDQKLLFEYKKMILSFSNIDRGTLLPEKYKNIFSDAGYPVLTYGDLSFISQANDISSTALLNCFKQIEELGFDKNILQKII